MEGLPIAKGKEDHLLLPRMANRHGLIAGATGTGKTVTLRVIDEHLLQQRRALIDHVVRVQQLRVRRGDHPILG